MGTKGEPERRAKFGEVKTDCQRYKSCLKSLQSCNESCSKYIPPKEKSNG